MAINVANDSLVIAQLRNVLTEADVLLALKDEFFFGHDDFLLESRVDPALKWLRDFMFGYPGHIALVIRYQNMYYAWPIYPNERSLKKPVGAPYKKRIEKSFSNLQWVIDHYYWLLKKMFDNLILDDDWYVKIERAIDLICTAYQDPIYDQFGLRKNCTILRPDEYVLQEITSEMVDFKKEWESKQ